MDIVSKNLVNIVQINLHHCRSSTAILNKMLTEGLYDVALIQEPWTAHGKILGLNCPGGSLLYDSTCDRPRACIFVNNRLNSLLLASCLDGDNVTIKITNQK